MATPNFSPQITYEQTSLVVADIIYRAARMARALKHPGQGVSVPSESTEFLNILNAMIDGWKIESLLIPYTNRTLMNVTEGQKVYSVGPGQDWGVSSDGMTPFENPEKIHRCGFIIPGSDTPTELPMYIILAYEEYAAYIIKDVQSSYPLVLYFQAAQPYGAATLWPVPSCNGQVAVYTPQLLSEFLTFDDVVLIRKGWREALMYNLAVAIHEMYPERPMDPMVTIKAAAYKDRVKANQYTPIAMRSDHGATQNTTGGEYAGGFPKTWTPYS
jgi:hypothetical protein